MAGWTDIPGLIRENRTQLIEEGVVQTAADDAMAEALSRHASGQGEHQVWAAFEALPRRADYPFVEPSDLLSIRRARSADAPLPRFDPTDDTLLDKMHGAWLGRCVGCSLGKPVEPFMSTHNGLASWQRIKTYLAAIAPEEWPIRDYIPKNSPAESMTSPVATWSMGSVREGIRFMETDDDIRYTVLGQIILERYGRDFTTSHVGFAWLEQLPYCHVCTAETQAYRNMVARSDHLRTTPDPSRAVEWDAKTDLSYIVHHLNPYREWIGAQIRVDGYAYAAAGNPELAAEFAWRDARLSHVKNGIYGAMLCAAMIAAGFATADVHAIVRAGLAQIPKTSRLHAEMLDVIEICRQHDFDFARFESVIEAIYDRLGHYNPVHTNNNAGLCVAALLLSGGDFQRGITLAVMGGWDTDCNGATVGSIVGAITGARNAPTHWTARLNDTLNSLIIGYHPIAISECARRSAAQWKRFR
jgi:ADP-ribosylglycohydrolase